MSSDLDVRSSVQLLKDAVTLNQVLDSYGLRGGLKMIPCPLHHESTPSMKIYDGDSYQGHFYCFGCRKHGDIISFVAEMESCTPGQAMAKLANRFNVKLVTREEIPNYLVSNLQAILAKKEPKSSLPPAKDLIHWQVVAEKAGAEFDTLESKEVPYLTKKKLPHVATRSKWDLLVVPMRDVDDKIWSFQTIGPSGEKKFVYDARKKGLMLRLGPERDSFAFICEGWATAASVYLSTNCTTYVAFSSNNIDNVATSLREKYPGIILTVAGDNDESGHMHSLHGIYPKEYKKDWSDVYMTQGPEVVRLELSGCTAGVV